MRSARLSYVHGSRLLTTIRFPSPPWTAAGVWWLVSIRLPWDVFHQGNCA